MALGKEAQGTSLQVVRQAGINSGSPGIFYIYIVTTNV
jgi:hypothetical protein